ncbi:MAG: endonuclease/exonuclease/phosphatase family protein [Tannerellaceae bacterium]|jgi:endonuclease/exonuclease/phosphatase family metal-dependent hydrolase|nr:endonuclease/exonuclease/phosphatase family protein [Tannerellaceae bacterium]
MRTATFKNIIRYFFVLANMMAAALLLAAAFSDRIAPDDMLFPAYLGLTFPLLCLLNAGFIVYWICLRRWKYLAVGALSLLLCWGEVSSYFPFHVGKDMPDGNIIKVLTYNVMGFGYMSDGGDRSDEIISYIARSGADIVCLQEYFVSNQEGKLTAQRIEGELSMYPYRSVVKPKNFGWGLAVYSKYPIRSSRRIEYESVDNGSSIHLIDINNKTLTLINNHLESFKLTSKDKLRYLDFIHGARPAAFDSLRSTIQQKLGPAFIIRARQARIIAREISESRADYILVCGDFNDTPISYAHRTVKGDLLDAFAQSGRGLGITYNLNYFWFRIDNILHSPNTKAYQCTVDHVNYSDHYPLWCYLQLN